MKTFWEQVGVSAALLLGIATLGCGRAVTPAASNQPAAGVKPEDEFIVGPGVTHGNLTLFPIASRTARLDDRLLTLDEGLAAGTVEVRELGAVAGAPAQSAADDDPFGGPPASANEVQDREPAPTVQSNDNPFAAAPGQAGARHNQVNKVLVLNKSKKPLYLMPGEIILGGDQDRTIGQELVIAPSEMPVEVDVFCVEHGRWGDKGHEETVAQLRALGAVAYAPDDERLAAARVADFDSLVELETKAVAADQGKFIASAGALSKSARLATQHDQSQTRVWDEVAIANAKGGVAIESGAFTGQYVEKQALQRLEPYLQKFAKGISDQEQVVGVVVAIDGKVESFDVFESTPLFRKLWPKLLKSYAVDAANAAQERDPEAAPATCSQQLAAKFVREAISTDVTSQEMTGELALEKRDSEKVLLFSAHDTTRRDSPAVNSAFGGGFGGSVHGFGAAK